MQSNVSKSSAPSPAAWHDPAHEGMDAVLARRRLLLRGLGKGAAAAAALAPMASQATRSYKLHNDGLGRDGYCSVSGFQSAVISLAPGGNAVSPCSAPGPQAYFLSPTPERSYTHINTAAARRAAVRDALAAWGVSPTPGDAVLNALAVFNGIWQHSDGKIYLNIAANSSSGGTLRQIAPDPLQYPAGANWGPGATLNSMVNDAFALATRAQNSLLFTLYNYQADDKAYVVAAFLGCIKEDNGSRMASGGFTSGAIPFDAKYVADQYKNTSTRVSAVAFFKTLCGG